MMDAIALGQCKERRLYRISSRNLLFGVFRRSTGGFIGIREKFGRLYLFEEYHRDDGPPYGTVAPLEELPEEVPADIELLASMPSECSKCGVRVEYKPWPEGGCREVAYSDGSKGSVPGQWEHLAPTECAAPDPVSYDNQRLFDWLSAMEKKYETRAHQP